MISLKMTKKQKKDMAKPETIGMYQEEYPYGTKLRFEKEQVDKIKILQSIKSGTEVKIEAVGFVEEVRSTDRAKGPNNKSVEIQIKMIAIKDNSDAEASFDED